MIKTLQKLFSNCQKTNKQLFFIVLAFLGFFNLEAQVATGYQFTQLNNQTYTPISGGTSIASGVFFNATAVANPSLGFNFNFNGTTYTSCNVTDNGFITFGTTPPLLTTYLPISGTLGYAGAISGFTAANGLVGTIANSDVNYVTTGSAPNRVFIVQYRDVQRRPSIVAINGLLNFQIKIYETTNVIEVVYNVVPTPISNGNGQVGLRGALSTDYNNRTGAWEATSTNGTVNTSSMILNSLTNLTTVNKYTWTPCYKPTLITASQIPNSVVSWTASAIPVTSYDYEIRTSGLFGSGAIGLYASGNTALTTFTASGLVLGQTYTVYVKSNCGTNLDTISTTILPVCNTATIPYIQDFESSVVPALPLCNNEVNVSGTAFFTKDNSAQPSGFISKNIETIAGNTWYFTQKINFPFAGGFKLSYNYGRTGLPGFEQKMRVAYGPNNAATGAGMTGGTIIEDHPSIKSTYLSNVVNFIVSAPGVYYIGFQCYAGSGQGNLQIDDIKLDFTSCEGPEDIEAINITSSSAVITWSPPVSANDGYIYYYSTSPIPPTNANINGNGATSAESFIMSGLSGSTTYYVWVRSICDAGDQFSAWIPLSLPGGPSFTTLFQPVYCIPVSATNQNYFTNVTTNNAIINFVNNSAFSPTGYGDFTNKIVSQAITGSVDISTTFNSMTGGVGVAVYVDWNGDGDFADTLPQERVFTTTAYITSPPAISFVVPVGATLGSTRMRVVVDWNDTTPEACLVANRGEAEDYTFVVVGPPPPLTLNINTSTQCVNTNSPLVTITSLLPTNNYNTYSWNTTVGITGSFAAGYIFNSNTTQTYTLTATQTVAPFSVNSVKFIYVATQLPSAIVIAGGPTIIRCQSAVTTPLVATGGVVSGLTVIEEDFNSGAPTWTTINNSTLGTNGIACAAWTIRPSGAFVGCNSQNYPIASNDNTDFYSTNGDSQGSGGINDTTLTSPIFSLVGYTNANLNYFQFMRVFLGNTDAKIQISTNGGGTFTTLQTWNSSTGTSGSATVFENINISLTPYVGNANVQIRFVYKDVFGWYWNVDNFKITGGFTSVTWSPTTDLTTDAAGLVAYTGGISATVYTKTNSNLVYTASATTISPACPTTTNVSVVIQPIVSGTISAPQTVCSGIANDLILTGHIGSNIQWESSVNLAFTAPINVGTNSITLTSAEIGAVVSNKYYRAKITNGTCTIYTNIVLIGVNAVTWTGTWSNGTGPTINDAAIFQSAYTSTGNLSACSIAITSGAVVTIGTPTVAHVLTVQNAITTTGGTLIFNNNSSLIQNTNITNTTPITYRRNSTLMNVYDFTYWSSPVANQNLNTFSPGTFFDKYFYWNTLSSVYYWTPIFNGAGTMATGTGYIIRSPLIPGDAPAIFNGSFVGNPNNGNLNTSIEVTGAANVNNLNLIGNPYPSGLSANLFLTTNSSVLDGTIYFWSHNTPITANVFTANDYASYNLTGGAATKAATNIGTGGIGNNNIPDGNIAAGQAFFAGGIVAGISTVNFTNAMRVTGNNNFYRNSNTGNDYEKNRIWLEMSNNQGAFSQMLYGNIEGATNYKDQLYDGILFDESPTVSLYSVLDNHKLTIKGNGLPFAETDTNQLGYISKIEGNYQIKLALFDGLFESQNIYLEDKFLNVIHDLKQNDYNFTTNIGTFDDRFMLRFTNTSLATNNEILKANNIIVYKDASGIHVKSTKEEIENVIIFDATGRNVIDKTNVNGTELNINGLQVAQQVLLVQVTTVDGKVTTRKIVF